ncbi:TetR/AcrR family transcriptional regulator [Streptomyces sp. NBC_01485]|uniref:TetR/AcrR family transcriptional regulator n=1 Tax=Streptomyces sp. NBC_01485 TaxID=2903884 RepID=UPI002E36F5AD|nr:TetR/AcrR family transcriptional regulator [Streptomyces sp. NBC_01485]
MTAEQRLTRRERYRRETVAQIKAEAMSQVHEGGTEAVSLNAVARSMAMSGPALYRYFGSRDQLLAELAVDAHLALAGVLEAAATRDASPASRVRAVAGAYRDWALAQPGAYHLAYQSTHGSGLEHATDRIVPAARRSMNVLLSVIAGAGEPPHLPVPPALENQIRDWNGNGQHHAPPAAVRHFGLVWWSRLHGLVSLELGGHLTATGVDPTLLYQAEIETMLNSLHHPNGTQS